MTAPQPSKFSATIDGRRVIVVIGSKSQTVNVCTEINRSGDYETVYRLYGRPPLTADAIAPFADLSQLTDWLESLGAIAESPGDRGGLPPLLPPPEADDPWLVEANLIVVDAIDRLVEQFAKHPYLHRVEHSMHAHLYADLVAQPLFQGRHPIGDSGQVTQLVHKEWPETVADATATKRGSFDLGILAPEQLRAASIDQFRRGRIAPGIVVEMGLDYGLAHLRQDHEKLLNSEVAYGYLVHLTRDTALGADVLQFAETADRRVRIAYVHSDRNGSTVLQRLASAPTS